MYAILNENTDRDSGQKEKNMKIGRIGSRGNRISELQLDKNIFLGYTLYIQRGGVAMIAQVKAWGNSQGVRLSKELLESAGIRMNDILNVELNDGTIVLKKAYKHRTLEERAAEFQGKVGPYEEFDWGEPVGRERW